jgi:hypothetical protein
MVETFEGRTFDWTSRHDPRSLDYPAREIVGVQRATRRLWSPGPVLDQGREGACCGYSAVGEALASPVRVDLERAALPGHQGDAAGSAWPRNPHGLAIAVYRSAQRIDEWEGEQYDGTSVLATAKVMRSLGFWIEYRWTFSVTELRDAVIATGPAILGIPWLSGMYRTVGEEVRAVGDVVGGHAILCNGYHPAKSVNGKPPREMFGLFNSWGPNWGVGGQSWIAADDLAFLLRDQGEACVPVHRSYGREGTLRRLLRHLFGGAVGGVRPA